MKEFDRRGRRCCGIIRGFVLSFSILSFAAALWCSSLLKNNEVATVAERSLAAASEEESSSRRSLRVVAPQQLPIKVFILVGQSNMQGHGYVNEKNSKTKKYLNGTLEWMVETFPEKYGKLKNFQNESSSWKERDDVWIAYNKQSYKGDNSTQYRINKHGKLIPGYGGDPWDRNHMGPELGFGWTVGDEFGSKDGKKQQILLLKIAWGGKSLAVDFRPPSSGGTTGVYYNATMTAIDKTIEILPQLFSDYEDGYYDWKGDGTTTKEDAQFGNYEIAGFAWHQGFNDMLHDHCAEEYEFNLANLIRDVRTHLKVPDLPFVIGASGMGGWKSKKEKKLWTTSTNSTADTVTPPRTRTNKVIFAQFRVSNPEGEFAGTVKTVETRDFFRPPYPKGSPDKQGYHWNNNCESYWLIGKAMGEAMVELIRNGRDGEGSI